MPCCTRFSLAALAPWIAPSRRARNCLKRETAPRAGSLGIGGPLLPRDPRQAPRGRALHQSLGKGPRRHRAAAAPAASCRPCEGEGAGQGADGSSKGAGQGQRPGRQRRASPQSGWAGPTAIALPQLHGSPPNTTATPPCIPALLPSTPSHGRCSCCAARGSLGGGVRRLEESGAAVHGGAGRQLRWRHLDELRGDELQDRAPQQVCLGVPLRHRYICRAVQCGERWESGVVRGSDGRGVVPQ